MCEWRPRDSLLGAVSRPARPFLKWAGGKGQLLEQFSQLYPSELALGEVDHYVEPFVGGGAVFFDLASRFEFTKVLLNDINAELICAYRVVQQRCEDLIAELRRLEVLYHSSDTDSQKRMYYNCRDLFNSMKLSLDLGLVNNDVVTFVALLVFLNRTCFNGLYRLNSAGRFNVPIGSYVKPIICDEGTLRAASRCLRTAELVCEDFMLAERGLGEFPPRRTFIYFDPPYRPLPYQNSFTSYSQNGFGEEEQRRLASWYRELDRKGYLLMLSNSDPKNVDAADTFFDEAYRGYSIHPVTAARAINSDASGRKAINEIVVTNYRVLS